MMSIKYSRGFLALCIFILTPVIMGMGSSSGGAPDKIPVPVKKFDALFIDQMDVATEVHEASIEGGTLIEGKKGEGTFTIVFDKIKSATFLFKEGKLDAIISLRDGSSLQLTVPKNKKAFGRTPYGTFQISLGDLKKMTIIGSGK